MANVKKKFRQSDARKFIRQISNYLEKEHGLPPQHEYPLGKDRWCSKSDIYVESKGRKLFIEVEGNQPHPDTNVTKYWYWIERTKKTEKVILIHVFGNKFYNNNYRSRTVLCSFIAQKIRKAGYNFFYYPVPVNKHHVWSKSWSILKLLELTKKQIKDILLNH